MKNTLVITSYDFSSKDKALFSLKSNIDIFLLMALMRFNWAFVHGVCRILYTYPRVSSPNNFASDESAKNFHKIQGLNFAFADQII